MNRDAILATLIGFFIGLGLTGIIVAGPQFRAFIAQSNIPLLSFTFGNRGDSFTPSNTEDNENLSIDTPLDEAIEPNNVVLVSGATHPGALVVAIGPVDEDIVEVGTDGAYAASITLVEGKNDIVVTSYRDDAQFTRTLTLFHTTEEF